ncbi:MAG: hypothetical protein RBR64_06985 [Bacteroidales bacterium]|jgi:hypothetical protein|nr:hypothetical protein [Bacteroidales bacterium]
MKKLALFILIVLISMSVFSQNKRLLLPQKDNILPDTTHFYKNMLGINVFPAFGLLGGGMMPSTKIYLQYKYMLPRFNIRTSINYINFNRQNERMDIIMNNQTVATDSIRIRKYFDEVFTYDVRLGGEYVFPRKDFRFYIGTSAIFGMHHFGRNYYEFYHQLNSAPNNYISADTIIPPSNIDRKGYSNTRMLKMGFDVSLGVDFSISNNCVVSIQYSPEMVYYHWYDEKFDDPDKVFTKPIGSGWVFSPDYIDIVIYINF